MVKKAKEPKVRGDDEESKRKQSELIKETINQRKIQEENNSRINVFKINAKWRAIMKLEKSKQLQLQLQILEQTHLRHLDCKSATINGFEKSVTEAEQQYSNALQAHVTNVDMLLELQESRLATLCSNFTQDLASLDGEFESERARFLTQNARDMADMLSIMGRMDHDFRDVEADAKHEYSSLKDDVKNKNLEEKHALRIQLESNVEELWRQFQTSTEERRKQFEELKSKDQKNANEIESQMKRLVKLQENIAHLKAKMSNNSKDCEERNSNVREEKEAIQIHFQAMKQRMNTFREHEKQKLTELTVRTSKVLRTLDEKVIQAERIIKLAEMNRKLETEEERALPFYQHPDVVVQSNKDEAEPIAPTSITKALGLELPREFAPMEQFGKRYNRVLLDRMALEQQRIQLQEENTHLKSILKQYLDGLTVNEEVLAQLNPLLVVNGKTNAPLNHTQKPVHVTYVEARHEAMRYKILLQ